MHYDISIKMPGHSTRFGFVSIFPVACRLFYERNSFDLFAAFERRGDIARRRFLLSFSDKVVGRGKKKNIFFSLPRRASVGK